MVKGFFIIDELQVYHFLLPEIIIGRGQDSNMIVNEPRVSRKHAKVFEASAESRQVLIADQNSSGGTFVNGHPIVQKLLQPGDVISLANCFEMTFQTDPELIPPEAKLYEPKSESLDASQLTGILDPDALTKKSDIE